MKLRKDQVDLAEMRPSKPVPEARMLRKQAGDWLKQKRAEAGLSQVDLAARLDLKYYTFISQVENGFSRVPTDMLQAWSTHLGLDPARVLETDSSTFVRPAPRPAFSVLGHDRWAAAGLAPLRDWREALHAAVAAGAVAVPPTPPAGS